MMRAHSASKSAVVELRRQDAKEWMGGRSRSEQAEVPSFWNHRWHLALVAFDHSSLIGGTYGVAMWVLSPRISSHRPPSGELKASTISVVRSPARGGRQNPLLKQASLR